MKRLLDRATRLLTTLVSRWPGQRRFGDYAFLPVFFAAGALLELLMVKWTVNKVNFYTVYKRRQVEELAQDQVSRELLRRRLLQSADI